MKSCVVVFENDLCSSCNEHKWMGMIVPDGASPSIAIACGCDKEIDSWIAGIAKLPMTDAIVCLDQTTEDFVRELSETLGPDKLSVRRR